MINRVYHMHAVARGGKSDGKEFFALARFKSLLPKQEDALRKMMNSAKNELDISDDEKLIVTSFSRC